MCIKEYFNVNVNKYDNKKNYIVSRPASLDNPKSNAVMFVMERYIYKANALLTVDKCLVFWPKNVEIPKDIENKHAIVVVDEPRKEYNLFFKNNQIQYYPPKEHFKMIDGAYIAETAIIGKNTVIMPGSYIGGEVIIGDDAYIGCGAKLVGSVVIGNRVIIRENVVIGADGLSTERDDNGEAITMPQFGGVVIEDKVQIGANTVIARGAIDNTIIREGSKIDNSCFISHNVVIEKNVFIVGETLIMGSAKIDKDAYISGNSVIRNKVNIGEKAFIGMGSVVTKDITSNITVMGNPAKERG